MIKMKDCRGYLRLLGLVLVLGAVAAAAATALGQDEKKESGSWQDLVVLYTTDVKGKIEPCG